MLHAAQVGAGQAALVAFSGQVAFLHLFQRRQVGPGALEMRKVRVEVFAEGIDVAALGAAHPKALHGGHQHHGFAAQVLWRQGGRGVQVQHHQRRAIGGFQRDAVGVARLLQGQQRLVADGGGRHQPQHHRKVRQPPGARHQGNGV